MNDHDLNEHGPFDHLGERMERAVGGLRAPDVVPAAIARGRRQRTHRRLARGASGLAAVTILALAVPAFADGWPGGDRGPSTPPVAADPTPTDQTSTTPTTASPDPSEPAVDACGSAATGWWSKPADEIARDLSALLPDGVRVGRTTGDVTGLWEGSLATSDGPVAAGLTLLPPPGVLGPLRTLEEVSRLGPCGGGANEPAQPVRPCDAPGTDPRSEERSSLVSCAEIRSGSGALVGVVTEQAQLAVVDGQDEPTDQTYVVAVTDGPGGGHVQLQIGDTSALTVPEVRQIVTDPVWTS